MHKNLTLKARNVLIYYCEVFNLVNFNCLEFEINQLEMVGYQFKYF